MLLIKNAIIYGESKDILIDGQSIIGIGYYDYSKLKESFKRTGLISMVGEEAIYPSVNEFLLDLVDKNK